MKKILAYHFDLKRAMWTRSYMDTMVDRLRDWGYTHILYEVEDKLRFSNHPAIPHEDAVSIEETSEFVRRCRAKGMDVIPFVQTLGHSSYVLKHDEYAHLRETQEITYQYDPGSKPALELIYELIDEVIRVMEPSNYFHIRK